jgi:DNA repair protein RadC
MNTDQPTPTIKRARVRSFPKEWGVVSLRECPQPESMMRVTGPDAAVHYWRQHVAPSPAFNADCEYVVVLLLNVRLRVRGHHVLGMGGLSEAPVHPRECFRAAVLAAAHAVVLMHNHPSGEPDPSTADQHLTRRIGDAGRILGIQLHDHVIVGHNRYFSFKEAGLL